VQPPPGSASAAGGGLCVPLEGKGPPAPAATPSSSRGARSTRGPPRPPARAAPLGWPDVPGSGPPRAPCTCAPTLLLLPGGLPPLAPAPRGACTAAADPWGRRRHAAAAQGAGGRHTGGHGAPLHARPLGRRARVHRGPPLWRRRPRVSRCTAPRPHRVSTAADGRAPGPRAHCLAHLFSFKFYLSCVLL